MTVRYGSLADILPQITRTAAIRRLAVVRSGSWRPSQNGQLRTFPKEKTPPKRGSQIAVAFELRARCCQDVASRRDRCDEIGEVAAETRIGHFIWIKPVITVGLDAKFNPPD